jgi:uncharacterized protein YpuA (DUF1002 family)
VNIDGAPSRRKGGRQDRLLIVFATLAILLSTLPGSAAATTTEQARTVAIGESNNQMQRDEILDFLGATDTDQVVTVTVDETVQSMGGVFDVSGIDTAYSSTALSCRPEGSGIEVTTRNIEVIPPELYALALLTAGMSDVELAVAAPNDAPALGMTAMTGVFKTWGMTPCSGAGGDPVRRQLALEELALIAEIGQEPGAVRQTTLVVFEAQREVIGEQVTTDQLDAIVASRAEAADLDLGDEDQAAIVDFLDRLSGAEIDWGAFTNGWATRYSQDGAGVVVTANADKEAAPVGRAVPAGVGGATGPIEVAPAVNAPASAEAAEANDPMATNLADLPTPTAGDDATTTFLGTVTERGRDGLRRWWPLAVLVAAVLLLGIGARRQPSETPTTWYVSRSRVFWLGRTVRRPAIVQSPRRRRSHVTLKSQR